MFVLFVLGYIVFEICERIQELDIMKGKGCQVVTSFWNLTVNRIVVGHSIEASGQATTGVDRLPIIFYHQFSIMLLLSSIKESNFFTRPKKLSVASLCATVIPLSTARGPNRLLATMTQGLKVQTACLWARNVNQLIC